MEKVEFLDFFGTPETSTKSASSRIHLIGVTIAMVFLGVITGFVLAKRMNRSDELAVKARDPRRGALRGSQCRDPKRA